MGNDWFKDICDFHREVMLDVFPNRPHIPPKKFIELRKKLIREEVGETLDAIEANDLIELADGICDAIVVLLGTAVTYGIDIRPVWDEVHKTNMAKAAGPMREDGKRLKPVGWRPPEVARLLRLQDTGYET